MKEQKQLPLRPNETVLREGSPVPGLHQWGKVAVLVIFGLPFLILGILASTALELEPGERAVTVWLHSRLERASDGDLGTTKAGFENIADAESVLRMIREIQEKA